MTQDDQDIGHQRLLDIMAIPLREIELMRVKNPYQYRVCGEDIPYPLSDLLAMVVKEMFDYSHVGTEAAEQDRLANYLWVRQWFRDDPGRVEVANYLDPANHSVWYLMTRHYSYREIILLCYIHLGSNWFEYFYGEFPAALHPHSSGFNTLVQCMEAGWTEAEINNHPIYGIYINVAEYHPNMDRLLRHFPARDN